jgi:excisionase family DNA binding protein
MASGSVARDRILTVEEVAGVVQLSVKTVMRAIACGDLEASQLSQSRGGWRVYESAISRWMERRSNRSRPSRPIPDVRRVDPQPGPRRPGRRRSGSTTAGERLAA